MRYATPFAWAALVVFGAVPVAADGAAAPPVRSKATLEFVVLDADTGKPVDDATVTVRKSGGYNDEQKVDAEGKAKVEYEAPASYLSVLVRGPGAGADGGVVARPQQPPSTARSLYRDAAARREVRRPGGG